MSLPILDFRCNDQLPTRPEIEALRIENGLHGRGIAIRKSPDGDIVAWVKYGVYVTTAEALTQEYVATRDLDADSTTVVRAPHVFDVWVTSNPLFSVGFIVMEHRSARLRPW